MLTEMWHLLVQTEYKCTSISWPILQLFDMEMKLFVSTSLRDIYFSNDYSELYTWLNITDEYIVNLKVFISFVSF